MFGVQHDEPARHIIKSAEAKAESLGCAMNTAVVDAGGNLVAHVRCAPGPSRTSWPDARWLARAAVRGSSTATASRETECCRAVNPPHSATATNERSNSNSIMAIDPIQRSLRL